MSKSKQACSSPLVDCKEPDVSLMPSSPYPFPPPVGCVAFTGWGLAGVAAEDITSSKTLSPEPNPFEAL